MTDTEAKNDKVNHSEFYGAPLLPMPDIPLPNHYGAYLQKRKHSVHTGVDLYVDEGTPVYAIEKGTVVIVRWFTGEKDGTPWWNDTQAVYIKGHTGVMCYGEVISLVEEGEEVEMGQQIATVTPVLKTDKGKATSMLHFALHRHGLDLQIKNNKDPEADDFYDLQLDPTLLLLQLKAKADISDVRYEVLERRLKQMELENKLFRKGIDIKGIK